MKISHMVAIVVAVVAIAFFASEASAYYNPSTGRFLSRDPGPEVPARVGSAIAEYADGMNLYQYAGSSPYAGTDPTGLATLKFETLPGWYEESQLAALGQARWCYRIASSCACNLDTNTWNILIDVEVRFAISLNSTIIAREQRTHNEVFGHEQRHHLRMQKTMKTKKAEIETALTGVESREYATEFSCNNQRALILRAQTSFVYPRLNTAATEGGRHARNSPPEARQRDIEDGYPLDREPYHPLPGTSAGESLGNGIPTEGGWVCSPVYLGR